MDGSVCCYAAEGIWRSLSSACRTYAGFGWSSSIMTYKGMGTIDKHAFSFLTHSVILVFLIHETEWFRCWLVGYHRRRCTMRVVSSLSLFPFLLLPHVTFILGNAKLDAVEKLRKANCHHDQTRGTRFALSSTFLKKTPRTDSSFRRRSVRKKSGNKTPFSRPPHHPLTCPLKNIFTPPRRSGWSGPWGS